MKPVGAIFKSLVDCTGDFISKNGRILAGVGAVAGVFATAALAYRARPKVDKIMANKKAKMKSIEDSENLTEEEKAKARKDVTKETAKELFPVLGPTIGVGIGTTALIVENIIQGEKAVNHWMNIAATSDMAYRNLSQATREELGDDKANKIEEKSHEKTANDYGLTFSKDGFIKTMGGDVPFYDPLIGRTFLSSPEFLEKAVTACNFKMSKMRPGEKKITLNDFYKEADLPYVHVGDDRFWTEPIIPNLSNAIPWNGSTVGSVRVLDWITRPMVGYSPRRL